MTANALFVYVGLLFSALQVWVLRATFLGDISLKRRRALRCSLALLHLWGLEFGGFG